MYEKLVELVPGKVPKRKIELDELVRLMEAEEYSFEMCDKVIFGAMPFMYGKKWLEPFGCKPEKLSAYWEMELPFHIFPLAIAALYLHMKLLEPAYTGKIGSALAPVFPDHSLEEYALVAPNAKSEELRYITSIYLRCGGFVRLGNRLSQSVHGSHFLSRTGRSYPYAIRPEAVNYAEGLVQGTLLPYKWRDVFESGGKA